MEKMKNKNSTLRKTYIQLKILRVKHCNQKYKKNLNLILYVYGIL